MTLISNDPSWWPFINESRVFSYFAVAGSVALMYDWALTFGQEVELIWRQRWSLMTILYLSVRYGGILYSIINMLTNVPTISMTTAVSILRRCLPFPSEQLNFHVGVSEILEQLVCSIYECHRCHIIYDALSGANDVVYVILGVIMITRLHAMYRRSRKMLIFLVVVFLAIRIVNVVTSIISLGHDSGDELILSGTYQCVIDYEGDAMHLNTINWILAIVWEVLALCLAVWIAVKHFRELRRHSTRGFIVDCVTVLMKSHVSYFASFVANSCIDLLLNSSTLLGDPYSLKYQICVGLAQTFAFAQMFVLGPRLILGLREYNAKLVADSDMATAMTSIVFQQRVHVSTSSSV